MDTNVIFSGLYSPEGAPGEILKRHAEGKITIVISRQVLEELARTVRNKAPQLVPLLHTFLTNAPPELTADPTPQEVEQVSALINPDDAPILAAAIKSGADCLVTGNTRHFTAAVEKQAKITIMVPAKYLTVLTRRG